MENQDTAKTTARQRPWQDYSHEVQLIRSRPLRYVLIGASAVFLLLGFIGLFLPVLPTTPFVLLSAACYARSSTRFYNMLMNHVWLGPPLRQWKVSRSISVKTKVMAIGLMALTMVPTIVFWVPVPAVKVGLAVIGLSVSIFLIRLPTTGTGEGPSSVL